eukprot:CAMPEP_0182425676 /NCGR_PEP_ID=MMETSP1167-20130531/12156_1 /TAXON_ID=2988 /ORGANISM="Mallomonas Sp, Strain CCMP3275" /LENGTH=731 /DNA_ID=CAMNT_0024606595 /DNA_START=187 /DNA_END=2382 /DNA_ORIENTATION=-
MLMRYVSLDIYQPLRKVFLGLKKLSEVVALRDDDWDEIVAIDRMRDFCNAATSAMDDLLLFDMMENDILEPDMKMINAWSFMRDIVRPFMKHGSDEGVKMDIFIPPAEVEKLAVCCVLVDKTSMRQALRGVVRNAQKFTPTNGMVGIRARCVLQERVTPTSGRRLIPTIGDEVRGSSIRPPQIAGETARMMDKVLRVEITDTGPGLSQESQARIFRDIGHVLSADGGVDQSSGLGLWIAGNIVQLHKGSISVTSEGEGRGSVFTIDLPLYDGGSKRDQKSATTLTGSFSRAIRPSDRELDMLTFPPRPHQQMDPSTVMLRHSLSRVYGADSQATPDTMMGVSGTIQDIPPTPEECERDLEAQSDHQSQCVQGFMYDFRVDRSRSRSADLGVTTRVIDLSTPSNMIGRSSVYSSRRMNLPSPLATIASQKEDSVMPALDSESSSENRGPGPGPGTVASGKGSDVSHSSQTGLPESLLSFRESTVEKLLSGDSCGASPSLGQMEEDWTETTTSETETGVRKRKRKLRLLILDMVETERELLRRLLKWRCEMCECCVDYPHAVMAISEAQIGLKPFDAVLVNVDTVTGSEESVMQELRNVGFMGAIIGMQDVLKGGSGGSESISRGRGYSMEERSGEERVSKEFERVGRVDRKRSYSEGIERREEGSETMRNQTERRERERERRETVEDISKQRERERETEISDECVLRKPVDIEELEERLAAMIPHSSEIQHL